MPVDTMDEALAPHIIGEQLYEIATKQWNSTHEQAADLSALRRDQFSLINGVATHIATNLPADHPEVFKVIAEQWPHLVPPKFEVSLSDQAFLKNNMSARGKLVKEIGQVAALELAKRYGHDSLHSRAQGARPENIKDPDADAKAKNKTPHANNPFHKGNWNISKQGALLKAVGPEKCAQIAASVGVTIGAIKPNPDF
jgi:hypothetical protein